MAMTRTHALAAAAAALTGTALSLEYRAVRQRGLAATPAEAAREAVEAAAVGYRLAPARENAMLNLLISYTASAALVRTSTYSIRRFGHFGPFRDRHVGGRHIHHFLPGIALAFGAGGASIVSNDPELDKLFAVPFGVGAALTLDEAALLFELEDVYWSEEGILSVQLTLGVVAGLGTLALARRALRRGEDDFLADDGAVEEGAPAA